MIICHALTDPQPPVLCDFHFHNYSGTFPEISGKIPKCYFSGKVTTLHLTVWRLRGVEDRSPMDFQTGEGGGVVFARYVTRTCHVVTVT